LSQFYYRRKGKGKKILYLRYKHNQTLTKFYSALKWIHNNTPYNEKLLSVFEILISRNESDVINCCMRKRYRWVRRSPSESCCSSSCSPDARCSSQHRQRQKVEQEGKRETPRRHSDWSTMASWRRAATNRQPRNSLRQSVIDFTFMNGPIRWKPLLDFYPLCLTKLSLKTSGQISMRHQELDSKFSSRLILFIVSYVSH